MRLRDDCSQESRRLLPVEKRPEDFFHGKLPEVTPGGNASRTSI
jgi:hypothetical protein